MRDLAITDLKMTLPNHRDQRRGLVGFIAFTLAGLRIDGVTLRRTRRGDLTLSFPARRSGAGQVRPLVHPVTSTIRDELLQRVLEELRLRESDAQTDGPSRRARS